MNRHNYLSRHKDLGYLTLAYVLDNAESPDKLVERVRLNFLKFLPSCGVETLDEVAVTSETDDVWYDSKAALRLNAASINRALEMQYSTRAKATITEASGIVESNDHPRYVFVVGFEMPFASFSRLGSLNYHITDFLAGGNEGKSGRDAYDRLTEWHIPMFEILRMSKPEMALFARYHDPMAKELQKRVRDEQLMSGL
jgi:hypothetical protein